MYFIKINVDKEATILSWRQDIGIIFSNLIENSIYWLENHDGSRCITIELNYENSKPVINYYDNGPGIDSTSIASGSIFEPGYTKKVNGTGLGLSIAGEAAERNGLVLNAFEFDEGAHFKVSGK